MPSSAASTEQFQNKPSLRNTGYRRLSLTKQWSLAGILTLPICHNFTLWTKLGPCCRQTKQYVSVMEPMVAKIRVQHVVILLAFYHYRNNQPQYIVSVIGIVLCRVLHWLVKGPCHLTGRQRTSDIFSRRQEPCNLISQGPQPDELKHVTDKHKDYFTSSRQNNEV